MYVEKKLQGIMIAAVKSGSGKTTLTCALLEILKKRGLKPQAFKCGPDYIDPMFHRKIIKVPSHNLDSFFSDKEHLCKIYAENMEDKSIAVVEGAMGLFDGLGGIREEGSAYQVASILKLPIILVVDAHGMGYSIIPLLSGFLQYDREKRIKGVILNRISKHFYQSIAPIIEKELHLSVLGFLPKMQELVIENRHLGLKLPKEIKNLQEKISCAAKILEENVNVDNIIEVAKESESVHVLKMLKDPYENSNNKKSQIKIGVAKDEAFCFYYEENLKLLEKEGAKIVFFSPLYDKKLPENLDGILLGGGYPELYAKKLEENITMRTSIKQAIENNMPSVAECGGFMYLHKTLVDKNNITYAMCEVLSGKCFYTGKLVRFGYIELKEKSNIFLKNASSIKGHEFHYFDSDSNGQDCTVNKPVTKKSWNCIHETKNHFWGFPHLYYNSNSYFAKHFIEEAKIFHEKNKRGV